MALSTSLSLVVSSLLTVLIFSALQLYKPYLANSQLGTIFGGFLGSWIFILSLTAVANLESLVLGKGFQSKMPEVVLCLFAALFACSTVHRVSVTTCFLFSLLGIFYMNKISQKIYNAPPVEVPVGKKNKKNK